jgi:hypothetical protein
VQESLQAVDALAVGCVFALRNCFNDKLTYRCDLQNAFKAGFEFQALTEGRSCIASGSQLRHRDAA